MDASPRDDGAPMDAGAEWAALQQRLDDAKTRRHRAERAAAHTDALLAAVADAEADLAVGSSPTLREVQDRIERLQHRLADARATSDMIVHRLSHVDEGLAAETKRIRVEAGLPEVADPEDEGAAEAGERWSRREVLRMQETYQGHFRFRTTTDAIGQDG